MSEPGRAGFSIVCAAVTSRSLHCVFESPEEAVTQVFSHLQRLLLLSQIKLETSDELSQIIRISATLTTLLTALRANAAAFAN